MQSLRARLQSPVVKAHRGATLNSPGSLFCRQHRLPVILPGCTIAKRPGVCIAGQPYSPGGSPGPHSWQRRLRSHWSKQSNFLVLAPNTAAAILPRCPGTDRADRTPCVNAALASVCMGGRRLRAPAACFAHSQLLPLAKHEPRSQMFWVLTSGLLTPSQSRPLSGRC